MEMERKDEIEQEQTEFISSKFTIQYLVSVLDRTLLQSIQRVYRLKQQGLDLIQFTRFFMNCIEHQPFESVFLATALSTLFSAVSKSSTTVRFSQITDFICDRILQSQEEQNQLKTRWVPFHGHDLSRLSYPSNPPVMRGGGGEVCKVSVGQSVYDKGKHDNAISQAHFSTSQCRIYSIQSLADWIGVYTPDARLERRIRPSCFKVKKDAAVLSLAFSEREERLGATLKDFSMSFWDAADGFSFEKSIATARHCQQLQCSLWYLQFFQKWVSADTTGALYVWSLLEERPQRVIRCRSRARVNDLCEIPCMGAMAVVQEQRGCHSQNSRIQLVSLNRGQVVAEVEARNDRRMLHTVKFSEEYQVLLAAGFDKRISLFELNPAFLDSTLKGELLGHQSAITCFSLIRRTPMVASADDKGKVKIWNIRNMKCMQTIDFTDKVVITRILDLSSQHRIAVLGSRITLLHLEKGVEEDGQVGVVRARQSKNSLWVCTQRDVRVYSLGEGKLQRIDCQYSAEKGEMTAVLLLGSGEVVTGNEKGDISIYSNATGKMLQTENFHAGPVLFLQEDSLNNLLLTASDHSGFVVLRKRKDRWEELRSLRGSFVGKEMSAVTLSAFHSLLAFISGSTIFILDYQQLKIHSKLTISKENPSNINFINGLGILVVGTAQGRIHFIEIIRNQIRHVFATQISPQPISHILADLKCRENEGGLTIESALLYCSDESGSIRNFSLVSALKSVAFKGGRCSNICYNPYRQVRQHFEMQLKKAKFEVLQLSKPESELSFEISILGSHSGGVNSLEIGEFDDHILISTGGDSRVKVWLGGVMVGDFNVNRPLPYLWEVNLTEKKRLVRQMLQGVELIQVIFKRFGKDISIGQSKVFKFALPEEGKVERGKEGRKGAGRVLRKKATLFQDQFGVVDVHYDKIKREKLLPIQGPSLKRMQIAKNVQTLQREWQTAKQQDDWSREQLLKSIRQRAIKNQEKDYIVNLLRDRNACPIQRSENSPNIKGLQEKLESSVEKTQLLKNESIRYSSTTKAIRDQQSGSMRCSFKRFKNHRQISTATFQNYFRQRYEANPPKTANSSSLTTSPRHSQRLRSGKENNFRVMLKEMQLRLSKCKNDPSPKGINGLNLRESLEVSGVVEGF